jgi:hypothetical protein
VKPFQFSKHYTLDEARALLPQIRKWFEHLDHIRERMAKLDKRISGLSKDQQDIGGSSVNEWVRCISELKCTFREFARREIEIKDLDRGLIDFPSIREGREVFLCWERGEEDIEHWHELDTGFAGREPL